MQRLALGHDELAQPRKHIVKRLQAFGVDLGADVPVLVQLAIGITGQPGMARDRVHHAMQDVLRQAVDALGQAELDGIQPVEGDRGPQAIALVPMQALRGHALQRNDETQLFQLAQQQLDRGVDGRRWWRGRRSVLGRFRLRRWQPPTKPCLVPLAQDFRGELGLAQASDLGFMSDRIRQTHVQHPVGLRYRTLGLLALAVAALVFGGGLPAGSWTCHACLINNTS